MKRIGILSGLLAVALIGSYLTWTDDEAEQDETEVVVLQARTGDLSSITWSSDDVNVKLERRTDDLGDYTWVTVHETVDVSPPEPEPKLVPDPDGDLERRDDEASDHTESGDESTDEDASSEALTVAAEPVLEEREVSFKGNDKADELWDDFAPMRAERRLGSLSDIDPSLTGLDDPTATIAVQRRDETLQLRVGGETYGSRDLYVALDDEVFLIDEAMLRPLEHAKNRLVERRLHPLREPEVERLVLTRGDATRTLLQVNRDDDAQRFWADASTPDTADEDATTWLSKLFRLRAQGYDVDADLDLSPVFTATLEGDDGTWQVEVLTADGQYYARSAYNRTPVQLTRSLASELDADMSAVFDPEG